MNNNPLQQYFRRPAVYIRLPSNGNGYPADSIDMPENQELPVYPMTAIDEISSRTPDGLYNGASVVNIIKSCIPNIKNPWHVSSLDLDTILLSIRAATGTGQLELLTTCPKCKDQSTYSIEIPKLIAELKPGNYEQEFHIHDLSFKFKPINFKELNAASISQFEVSKQYAQLTSDEFPNEEKLKISQNLVKTITEQTMLLVAKGIEYIKSPNSVVTNEEYILDYLKNCDKNTYVAVRDYSTSLKKSSEIQPLHIKCSACSHEYDQEITINPSDFFG
jgi:hypothetical protein